MSQPKQPNWSDPQLRNVLDKYREGQLSGTQAKTLITGWLKGYGYREKKYADRPPEGYYYKPDDVKAYNEQVKQYNRKVQAYRNEVALSLIQGQQPGAARPTTPAELSAYLARKGADPDVLYYETREGPPQDVGPPAPSKEELQERLRRRESGLETRPGIPGPAWGPKTGTAGAQAQQVVQEAAERTLAMLEYPFQVVSSAARAKGQELKQASREPTLSTDGFKVPLMMDYALLDRETNVMFSPEEAKKLGMYVGGVALGTAATAFDVATFKVRPGLWVSSVKGAAELAFSPGARGRLAETIMYDPIAFGVETIGGIKLGLSVGPYVEAKLGEAYRLTRPYLRSAVADIKLGKIADVPTTWKAIRGREKIDMDLTGFEKELGLDFPEETTEYATTRQLYTRSQLITYDPKTGLVKQKIPYYIEAEPEFMRTQEILEVAEEWSPTKVKSAPDIYSALPYSEKGSILVKGKLGMKPFKDAVPEMAPRSDAIQVLTTKGVVSSRLESWIKPVAETVEYVGTEIYSGALPAVRLTDIITPVTVIPPGAFTRFSLGSIFGVGWKDKAFDVAKPTSRTDVGVSLRQFEKTMQREALRTDLDVGLGLKGGLKMGDWSKLEKLPRFDQKLDEIQMFKTGQREDQFLVSTTTYVQPVKVPFPTFGAFLTPRKEVVKVPGGFGEDRPRKKKTKKKRGVYEVRVDPVKMPPAMSFKVPKMPGFGETKKKRKRRKR